MSDDLERYRLKEGFKRIVASDIVIERGETVDLHPVEATAINDARPEPVLERAGGSSDGDTEDTDA